MVETSLDGCGLVGRRFSDSFGGYYLVVAVRAAARKRTPCKKGTK
jgi:hypothetical protein